MTVAENTINWFKSFASPVAWRVFFDKVKDQLKRHSLILLTSILFFVCGLALKYYFGLPLKMKVWPYLQIVFFMILPIAFLGSQVVIFLYLLLAKRPKNPLREFFSFYRDKILDLERHAKAIPMFIVMTIGFVGYTECKPLIPLINNFAWDTTFAQWDRALHFGVDPWRLLLPVFGSGLATFILNFLYNLWFIIMFTMWLCAIWTNQDHGWERPFLLSFLLSWFIGGFLLATGFSSMGPAFYDLIDPNANPFDEQMALLNSHNETYNIWALKAQETLRESFLNPAEAGIAGISAMPSLHNATTTLFAIAAFRIHRALGYLMTAYLIAIVIGSVHLAWHYAIDAYAGIILAIILWKVSVQLTIWQDRQLDRKMARVNVS